MSTVAAIRELLAKGFTIEQALTAAEAFEPKDDRTLRQKRNARYYDRLKASEIKTNETIKTLSDALDTPPSPPSPPSPFPLFPPPQTPPPIIPQSAPPSPDFELVERPEKKALRGELMAFGEAWNELAASLRMPSIDEIKSGSTRERHALARLREMDPDGARDLLARIRGSPYLRGEVNGFRCTFDWIVNASNFQKIMEGNYEDRKITQLRR